MTLIYLNLQKISIGLLEVKALVRPHDGDHIALTKVFDVVVYPVGISTTSSFSPLT